MLRRVFLVLPALILLFALPGLPAGASGGERLSALLDLPRLAQVLHREGVDYGRTLEEEMFPGQGGLRWQAEVARIHAADRILAAFNDSLSRSLTGQEAALAAAEAFYGSDLGRRAVGLELSAREAFLDEDVKEAAELAFLDLAERDPERLAALERFIAVNDLIETNVAGALNSNLAFMMGLEQGGAGGPPMTESDMLSDLWTQEEQIRADIESWVYPYLALAYQPLTVAEIEAYTDFTATAEGQRVNAALFTAFDEVFVAQSRELGRVTAGFLSGQDI
jgi:hypothetical protein